MQRDAGVVFACQLPYIWEKSGIFDGEPIQSCSKGNRQLQHQKSRSLNVVELGAGCGTVSIS